MMVAGAVELLASQPPVLVAEQIRGWTAAQYQGRTASLPVSDYLFHALKKIHLLAELKLVPTDKALRLLGGILPLLETFCPEEDRGLLRDNVSRLGSAATTLTSPVETIYRQVGSEQPLASRGRPADAPGPHRRRPCRGRGAPPAVSAGAARDERRRGPRPRALRPPRGAAREVASEGGLEEAVGRPHRPAARDGRDGVPLEPRARGEPRPAFPDRRRRPQRRRPLPKALGEPPGLGRAGEPRRGRDDRPGRARERRRGDEAPRHPRARTPRRGRSASARWSRPGSSSSTRETSGGP